MKKVASKRDFVVALLALSGVCGVLAIAIPAEASAGPICECGTVGGPGHGGA
jgi:hypothetical protein